MSDDRETPARPVVRALRKMGAVIVGHDPHLESFDVDGEPAAPKRKEAVR